MHDFKWADTLAAELIAGAVWPVAVSGTEPDILARLLLELPPLLIGILRLALLRSPEVGHGELNGEPAASAGARPSMPIKSGGSSS
jgi:hypothetical protein